MTSSTTLANTICFSIMHDEVNTKLRGALEKNFVKFGAGKLNELAEEISLETLDMPNDEYLKYCFYETLRIEPPVPFGSSVCMTEDTIIKGFKIKAGDPIYIL